VKRQCITFSLRVKAAFWVRSARFVVLVAMVEYDGRMTYWQKALRLALLLVPHFCL
jgi:hypothetical protein